MAQVDVVTERVIRRPIGEVADFAGDPLNAPRWYAAIDTVTLLGESPMTIGSQMAFEARFLGRRLVYTYEVVDLVPGSRLVMRTAQGPFPMETTYEWEPAGPHATRMRLRNRGEPRGFASVTAPVMVAAMRRANENDLFRLAELLES